jgi:hypothetical protein
LAVELDLDFAPSATRCLFTAAIHCVETSLAVGRNFHRELLRCRAASSG